MSHIVPQNLLGNPGGDYVRDQVFAKRQPSGLLDAGGQSLGQIQSFLPHTRRQDIVQAGSNVTITYNALGPVIAAASGTGDVVGPASAVNNRVVFFDGTTGKLIKDSGLTLSGSNTGDQSGVSAGSATTATWVNYNGTTQASAQFDGSTTAPSHTTRLNYDGYFYATKFYGDGGGLTNLPSSTGGALTYVGTATVSGAAATTLVISGLDLATDGEYLLEIRLDNATASNVNISLFNTSDTTAGNYSRQSFLANNTTLSGARAADGIIGVMTASEGLLMDVNVRKDLDSKTRVNSFSNYDQPSAILLRLIAQIHNATTALTSITLSASVASSLAIGSYVNVYKRKP